MLLVNPKILAFDAGFQLSFLATMGLVYLSPILEKYFSNWPEFHGLKNSLLTTVSAIIFTTPLILYQFGRLSIVAPLVNILVLPVIPWAMALGFAVAAVGMILWPLGWVMGWFVWLALSYIILIVRFFGNLPWSSIEIKGLPWWTMLIGYILISLWIWREHTNKHELKTN
jgi:competence protein ComEC